MQIFSLSSFAFLSTFTYVRADALGDFGFLQWMVQNSATQLLASVPPPVAVNVTGPGTGSYDIPYGSAFVHVSKFAEDKD